MTCKQCLEIMDTYLEGNLSDGMKAELDAHLEKCADCAKSYDLLVLANRVIQEEKKTLSNPFLSTRVMSQIEMLESKKGLQERVGISKRILQPLLISVFLAAAIFLGIIAGNVYGFYYSDTVTPVEITYMDDASMEMIHVFSVD